MERSILDTLRELRDKYTYALPRTQVLQRAAAALPAPPTAYKHALDGLLDRGKLVLAATRGLPRLLLPGDARDERRIVSTIRRFRSAPKPAPIAPVDRAKATEEQRAAIHQALSQAASIILGPPGSGKTTIVEAVVATATAAGLRVALSCSIGIAVLRLAKVTKRPAVMVHRLLRADPADETLFRRTADNSFAADLLVVGECSMLDLVSLVGLLEAIQAPTRLVLVGDPYQLPPPGASTPFLDLAETKALPITKLTYSFRNEGLISVARQRIRPLSSEHAGHTAVRLFAANWHSKDEDGRPGVRLMMPMHAGEVGTCALNALAKRRLNRFGERRGMDVGGPELQTKNNCTLTSSTARRGPSSLTTRSWPTPLRSTNRKGSRRRSQSSSCPTRRKA